MKWIIVVVTAVIVAALGWWYFTGVANAPAIDRALTEGDKMDSVATGSESATSADVTVETSSVPTAEANSAKIFNVTGKNFEFSTKEIRVKKGDTVTINFESTNGFHDWKLDEFNARTQQVRPGTKTSTTFVADQAGTFEYYCSIGDHRALGMKGELIVE